MRIPVVVYDKLYIPRAPELRDMLDQMRAKCTHKNPDYYKARNQGRWVGNIKPTYETWSYVTLPEYGPCLALSRGATNLVRKVFKEQQIEIAWVDNRHSLDPIEGYENNVKLWPEQDALARIMFQTENCLIRSPTGSGKCLAPETPILLFDGRIIRAYEVVEGDLLMGPDSRPRSVISTTQGHGPMYRIEPKKGEPWCCNDVHVLTLINTTTGRIIDIPLNEYLEKNKTFKHEHKLFVTGVEFPIRDELPIDPYFLGIWLGDGRKSLTFIEISKNDIEIRQAMEDTAIQWGLLVDTGSYSDRCDAHRIVSSNNKNYLLWKLRTLMSDGIRIPISYLKHSSQQERLQLLAGLLDTDGHQAGGYFEITQKRELLARDIEFLARSLGFRTTWKEKPVNGTIYYRINILGNVSRIPTRIPRKQAPQRKTKKDARRVGFDVTYIGHGDYVGWTLDKDGRFLLGDFTVTHNTETLLKVAEWILKTAGPVLIIVWEGSTRSGLMNQWIERISQRFEIPRSEIGVLGGGQKRVRPLTVAMQQTLKNVGRRYILNFGGVICDEIQRFAAPTFQKVVDIYPAQYRFGASADECVAAGTNIMMGDGSERKIETIQVGEYVSTPLGPRKVTGVFNTGIRETIECTSDISKLNTTRNTLYATIYGWKENPSHVYLYHEQRQFMQSMRKTNAETLQRRVPHEMHTVDLQQGWNLQNMWGVCSAWKRTTRSTFLTTFWRSVVERAHQARAPFFDEYIQKCIESEEGETRAVGSGEYSEILSNSRSDKETYKISNEESELRSIRGKTLRKRGYSSTVRNKNDGNIETSGVRTPTHSRNGERCVETTSLQTRLRSTEEKISNRDRRKQPSSAQQTKSRQAERYAFTEEGMESAQIPGDIRSIYAARKSHRISPVTIRPSLHLQTFDLEVEEAHCYYANDILVHNTRKDGKEFLIYDIFGRVAGEIEKVTLVEKKKIHELTFRIINTETDYSVRVAGEDYSWKDLPPNQKNFNDLLHKLCWDKDRNELIWRFMEPCFKGDNIIIVATHRIEHAKWWEEQIRNAGYTTGLMLGGVEQQEEFETTANSLRTRKIQCGVGTIQKIAQGHDIPSLNRGFVLTPLAGNKQVFEQLSGRLRRTCPGKNDAVLYYFWDSPIYPGHKNSLRRIYKGKCQLYVDGEFLPI